MVGQQKLHKSFRRRPSVQPQLFTRNLNIQKMYYAILSPVIHLFPIQYLKKKQKLEIFQTKRQSQIKSYL